TVFYAIWRDPYMTIGRDTYVHDMLSVCGGANVFADRPERYRTVTLDDIVARRPAVILLPDEPFRFRPAHVGDFASFGARVHLVGGRVGQLGDRAQGLRLALSDLGALALGDVLQRALVVQHAPAGRADGPGALARRDDASVVTTQLHLHVADHAVPLDRAPPALAILHTRVDVGRVHGQQGRAIRIAEHRDQRPVDVEDPSLGRRPIDADGHTL